MGKRTVYTKITPLPSNVPRQLALDMLHSHGEIIQLNPLVTGHTPIPAPRDAARDEFFAQWYEIDEIITWGFGVRKKIAFKAVFHDMPWGLQTHTYAPMGVDLRNKYQVCGNQPGEPKEVRELGIDAPAEGLYLREDVEIVCNIALAGYVKKETTKTLQTMIERMTRKAELLDEGVLMAMWENGKLKTVNPNQLAADASKLGARSSSTGSSPASPLAGQGEFAPSQTFQRYSNLPGRMHGLAPNAVGMSTRPVSGYSNYARPQGNAVEMEAPIQYGNDQKSFTAELADTSYAGVPPRSSYTNSSPNLTDPSRNSTLNATPSFRSNTSVGSAGKQSISSSVYTTNDASPPPPLQPHRLSSGQQGGYSIANPDQPVHQHSPPYRHKGSQDSGYQAYGSPPQGATIDQTLAAQIGGLKIGADGMTKCPICSDFSGSKEDVSRHVNRNHFSP